MKYLIFLILLIKLNTSKSQGVSTIIGDNVVNIGDYSNYTVNWGSSVSSYSIITWTVSGGDLVSSFGNSCEILWQNVYREGTIEVQEDLGGQFANLTVQVGSPYLTLSQDIQWNTIPSEIEVEGIDNSLFYSFQWQVSSDNINWSDIVSANTFNYLPTNTLTTLYYKCIVTSGSTTVSTNSVVVNLIALYPGSIQLNNPCNYNTLPSISVVSNAYGGFCNPTNYLFQWEISVAGASWQFIGTSINFPSSFTNGTTTEIKVRRRVTCGSEWLYSNTLTITPVFNSPNSENFNYIRINDISIKGINSWYQADLLPIGTTGKQQTTDYLDGLGRIIQTNSKEASQNLSNGLWKDMITHYDFKADPIKGNVSRKHLPFVSLNNNGFFVTNAQVLQKNFIAATFAEPNNSTVPFYSETIYDNSSLGRVVKEMLPGKDYGGNNIGISYTYDFNQASENVHIFNVDYSTGNLQTTATLEYPTGKLFKNTITDEKGKLMITYSDFSGNIILKKVQLEEGSNLTAQHNGWACTYYVYDDFGLLRYTITPKAVDILLTSNWAINQSIIDELCFVNKYDDKGRKTYTKQPGIGFSSTVYDGRNRPILTQNALERVSHKWSFTLYDELDRTLATGVLENTNSWIDMQMEYNNTWNINNNINLPPTECYAIIDENGTAISFYASNPIIDTDGGGVNVYLSNTTNSYFNSINFYDFQINSSSNYSFIGSTPFSTAFSFTNLAANINIEPTNSSQISKRTFGSLVGTSIRILNNTGTTHTRNFKTNVQYYNEKGNVIQSISQNIKGGTDIHTSLYHFSGLLLNSHNRHTATINGNLQTIQVITYPQYDKIGRVIFINKKYNNNNYKTITHYNYNAFSNLNTKILAPTYYNNVNQREGIETQHYTYTINGALEAINKNFVETPNIEEQWEHYFGFHLGYANASLFNIPQYNGTIAGSMWKTQGDNTPRKYDYTYDNLGRLTNALYDQKDDPSQSWGSNQLGVDYNNSIQYADKNGNIGSMLKMGMLPGINGAVQVDNLNYRYAANSNKLLEVRDLANNHMGLSNGKMGDFVDGTNAIGTNDYTYDANGNITTDLNKIIQTNNIIYNSLNKPEKITTNRSSSPTDIEYTYNAFGEKLSKKITVGGNSTITTYIGNYIYTQTGTTEKLEYILHEEGRIKLITPIANENLELNQGLEGLTFEDGTVGVFEYFLKDHLSNTRMVLTEEEQIEYYRASMDAANASNENELFGQVDHSLGDPYENNELAITREVNPSYWNNNSSNGEVCLLNASDPRKIIGPNLMLKVMAGDKITSNTSYYYFQNNNSGGPSNDIENVINALIGSLSTRSTGIVNLNKDAIRDNLIVSSPFYNFLDNNPNQGNTSAPKAYLNIVFFDEQFNFIPPTGYSDYNGITVGTNVIRVDAEDTQNASLFLESVAPKNGYVFAYLSNSSDENVYFDNFYTRVEHSRISEETHYYAYGQKIAGISSIAFNKLLNNYKFQANFSEEETETGYNEFDLRMYDPQIGRWAGADPYDEFASPYVGMGNNPINLTDPNGGSVWSVLGPALATGTMNVINNWEKIEEKGFLTGVGYFASGAVGGFVTQQVMASDILNVGFYGATAIGATFTGIGNFAVENINEHTSSGKVKDRSFEDFLKIYSKAYSTVMAGQSLVENFTAGASGASSKNIINWNKAIKNGIQNFTYDYGASKAKGEWGHLSSFFAGATGSLVNDLSNYGLKNSLKSKNMFVNSLNKFTTSFLSEVTTSFLTYNTDEKWMQWNGIKEKYVNKALIKSTLKATLYGAGYKKK